MAIWHLTQYNAAGAPSKVRLVELGPGRGTLMADTLRVFKQLKLTCGILQSVHLVETSDAMWDRQKATLQPILGDDPAKLVRHESLEELLKTPESDVFTMVNAHEFFDALPIHVIEVCLISLPPIFLAFLTLLLRNWAKIGMK